MQILSILRDVCLLDCLQGLVLSFLTQIKPRRVHLDQTKHAAEESDEEHELASLNQAPGLILLQSFFVSVLGEPVGTQETDERAHIGCDVDEGHAGSDQVVWHKFFDKPGLSHFANTGAHLDNQRACHVDPVLEHLHHQGSNSRCEASNHDGPPSPLLHNLASESRTHDHTNDREDGKHGEIEVLSPRGLNHACVL